MPNSTLSELTLPVKNESTGQITNQTFNLGGSGAPVLPIDPTDATYKSTPGAIWIETS